MRPPDERDLSDPTAARRERRLSRLVFFLPLLAYVVVYFVEGVGFHPGGDGKYSWMFARSLAFDGDIEFRNDYALCGDHFAVGIDRGTGHPDNPFYFGPAAFLVPTTLLLRLVFSIALGAEGAAQASCAGWFTAIVFLAGPICGALSVWLSYKAARFVVSASTAAFTALVFAFSSSLFPYSSSVAHYSHVYLTVATAAVAYISVRTATRGPRPSDGLGLGVAMALIVAHRLPSVVFGAVPLAVNFARAKEKDPRALVVRNVVGIAIGSLVGIGTTGLVYRYLYGRWFAVPQGPDFMHLGHAHPWLVLFGVHGGFFFWTPAAWLAIGGLVVALRRPELRWLTAGVIATATIENYVSSAALDWWAGWSLGARRLVPLVPFVVVYAALAIDAIRRRLLRAPAIASRLRAPRAPSVVTALLAIAVASTLANGIHASTLVRGDDHVSQRELYGAWSPLRPLWAWLDELGVDLAILPAEAYFVARYQLPPSSYRAAIFPRYRRDYRSLAFTHETLDLTDPTWAALTRGGEWSPAGVHVSNNDAHLVFTAEWPFATHVRVTVTSAHGGELEWRADHLLDDVPAGVVTIPATDSPLELELRLPPNAFDSGVNDWVLRAHGDVVVSKIVLEDRTPRVPYGARGIVPSTRTASRDRAMDPRRRRIGACRTTSDSPYRYA